MIPRLIPILLLVTNVLAATIFHVRRPIVIDRATGEDCRFAAAAIASAATAHGLKDRTFVAPDHRIFAMFESRGRVVGRYDADRITISFYFDVREREVSDSIYNDLLRVLKKEFGSRVAQ